MEDEIMVHAIFFVALFIFLAYVFTQIVDDYDGGIFLGGTITLLVLLVWFTVSLVMNGVVQREETIQTNAIVYNKNNECYVYMNQDDNEYKLIHDGNLSEVSSYSKSETEVMYSDENVIETHIATPVNKVLVKVFCLVDHTKYVIKTNEVKMILK